MWSKSKRKSFLNLFKPTAIYIFLFTKCNHIKRWCEFNFCMNELYLFEHHRLQTMYSHLWLSGGTVSKQRDPNFTRVSLQHLFTSPRLSFCRADVTVLCAGTCRLSGTRRSVTRAANARLTVTRSEVRSRFVRNRTTSAIVACSCCNTLKASSRFVCVCVCFVFSLT